MAFSAGEIFVALGIDPKILIAGLKDADRRVKEQASKSGKDFGDGFTRDATGRLRNAKGQYVKEGQGSADGFEEGFRGFGLPAISGAGGLFAASLARVRFRFGDEGEEAADEFAIGFRTVAVASAAGTAALYVTTLTTALDFDAANDKMAAQLGLDAGQSARLGKVAGSIYAGAYGESIEEVNIAVGSVRSSIRGMASTTDAELQAMTITALNYASTFDTDVVTATATAGAMIKQGLAKDGVEAFDLMTAAAQKMPAEMRGELPAILKEYSKDWAALGITGPQAMAAIVEASRGGEFVLDKQADSMKEFAIRATDLGDVGAQDALKALGLDGKQMANDLLAGGDTAREATRKIAQGLLDIEDPAARSVQAIALFGTPLEDLGKNGIPKFLGNLAGTSKVLGETEGAADRMGKTLNGNAKSDLTSFARQIKMIGVAGAEWAIPYINQVASAMSTTLAPALRDGRAALVDDIIPALRDAGGALAEDFGPALLLLAGWLYENVLPALSTLAAWLRDDVIPVVSDVAGAILDEWLPPLLTIASTILEKLVPAIAAFVTGYGGDIWNVVSKVLVEASAAHDALSGAIHAAMVVVNALITALAWVIDVLAENRDIVYGLLAVYAAYRSVMIVNSAITGAAVIIWHAMGLATKAWAIAQRLLNGAMVLNPIGLVIAAVVALVAIFIIVYRRSSAFRLGLHILWEAMKSLGSWIVDVFMGAIHGIGRAFGWVKEKVSDAFGWVRDNWPLILAILTGPIGLAVLAIVRRWDRIRNGAGRMKDAVVERFEALVGFITGLPDRITEAASGLWDGLTGNLKDVIQGILDLWNGIDFSIKISIPDWVPTVGGKKWESPDIFPDVPALATGGYVPPTSGGRIVRLAEGGEGEWVIPRSKAPQWAAEMTGASGSGNSSAVDLDRAAAHLARALVRKMQDTADGAVTGAAEFGNRMSRTTSAY